MSVEPLTIQTPAEQWAYAASFPLPLPVGEASAVIVHVEIEVHEGEVGVGLLAGGGQSFVAEEIAAAADGRLTLELRKDPSQAVEQLIIRNVNPARQPSRATIPNVTMQTMESVESSAGVVRLSSSLFERFIPFEGRVPAGFWVNWLGVLTRDEVWPFPADVMELYSRDRYERCGYPTSDEHVLDWAPLLQAVADSGDEFTMIALGAGWGRWLSAAAAACQQLGRTYRLTGVEAEPDHFRWMKTHLDDNRIPPDRVRLIEAAASGTSDPCWFPIDQPGWYGQSLLPITNGDPGGGQRLEAEGRVYRRLDAVTIDTLIADRPLVSYLHMDIQGAEYEFLARAPAMLSGAVRVVNVGTHSAVIERRLRSLFRAEGWEPLHDFTIGSSADVVLDAETVGHVTFGDGVQVWLNPRLR